LNSISTLDAQLLLEVSSEGLSIVNFDGEIIDVNQKFIDMLGYEREELLALSLYDFDLSLRNIKLKDKLTSSFINLHYRSFLKKKDGKKLAVEISAFYDVSKSDNIYIAVKDIQREINAQTRTNIIDKL